MSLTCHLIYPAPEPQAKIIKIMNCSEQLRKLTEKTLGQKILWLPINISEKGNIKNTVKYRLDEYQKLFKDGAPDDLKLSVNDKTIENINKLISGLLVVSEILYNKNYNDNYFNEALEHLSKTLNAIQFKENFLDDSNYIKTLKKSESLYRLRNGEHVDKLEMFHCPSVINGNPCGIERFSLKGFPMLYCGASQDACEREVYHDKSSYTTAEFILEDSIKYFDLACVDLNYKTHLKDTKEKKFYLFWPIIALCYIVDNSDKEHSDSKAKNLTYLFPQLLAAYIQKECPDIKCIRYFTVRNENLDPTKETFTDYAFFTDAEICSIPKNHGYDMKLYQKFNIRITVHKEITYHIKHQFIYD